MQLREVMTRDVEVIRPESTLVEAARRMKDLDVGPIPVCDDNRIVGMVTDRDIATRAVAEGRDPKQTRVRDVMTPDVIYCFEDDDVDQAARLMQERQVRRLLVLKRNRELAGIVSLGDLASGVRDERLASATLQEVSHETAAAKGRAGRHERLKAQSREGVTEPERDLADNTPERAAATIYSGSSERRSALATQLRPRDLSGRKTVAGLFSDRQSAERAIGELRQAGFTDEQIGTVMRDRSKGGYQDEPHKETHAAEGAMTGVLGGGVLGGVAGYLIAIGALAIPGVGPVLAGGALAEALGVIAGTAAVGAGIGAAAGGLVGVLVGMGIPEEEAHHFERGFSAEEVLVTVKAGERVMEAVAIMEMNDADTGVGRAQDKRH